MNLQRNLKEAVKVALSAAGLELRRLAQRPSDFIPPLHADPLVSLHEIRGGKQSSFRCPLEKIVDFAGFGFGSSKWHPFVTTLQLRNSEGDAAAEAFLSNFYSRHQPRNAAEAFLGFSDAPISYQDLEPWLFQLTPWTAMSPEELTEVISRWTAADNAEHGKAKLTLQNSGFKMLGPAGDDKRKLEFHRLCSVVDSIKANGYNRSLGDCSYLVVKRYDDFRFIPCGGGFHRAVAMAALKYDWVPGYFFGSFMIDYAEVEYWPQVRKGVWSKSQALAYVDYLFDYNSRDWYTHNIAKYRAFQGFALHQSQHAISAELTVKNEATL